MTSSITTSTSNVIEQINQKIDRILIKMDELEKRLIDIEITSNFIEREIKNKSKSSKGRKALIKMRNEEPIVVENISYQKGSFDEWIYNNQLPKIKQDLEEINRLKRENLSLNKEKKEQKIDKKLKSAEKSSSNGESN